MLTTTFVFAAEDCKQLAKLPKVKCLRNSERQGRLYHGAGQACEWRVGWAGVCIRVFEGVLNDSAVVWLVTGANSGTHLAFCP